MYYDRVGNEICESCWKEYWADDEYRVLARTDVGEWTVAAWWAGVDDGGNGTPRVFRTGLLVPPRQGGYASPLLQEWHHASIEKAIAHHDDLVARFRSDDAAPEPVRAEVMAHSCHCD
jgi:hypothetical protein